MWCTGARCAAGWRAREHQISLAVLPKQKKALFLTRVPTSSRPNNPKQYTQEGQGAPRAGPVPPDIGSRHVLGKRPFCSPPARRNAAVRPAQKGGGAPPRARASLALRWALAARLCAEAVGEVGRCLPHPPHIALAERLLLVAGVARVGRRVLAGALRAGALPGQRAARLAGAARGVRLREGLRTQQHRARQQTAHGGGPPRLLVKHHGKRYRRLTAT